MKLHSTPEEEMIPTHEDPAPENLKLKTSNSRQAAFSFRSFQIDDMARAGLHDGVLLGWEPGLGKTMPAFTMPILWGSRRTLIVVQADLHEQLIQEAREKFGLTVRPLPNQATALRYMREGILPFNGEAASPTDHCSPITDHSDEVLPSFFITAYNWLGYIGADETHEKASSSLLRMRRLGIIARLISQPDPGACGVILSEGYRPRADTSAAAVLGVPEGATPEQIRAAWRTASRLYHPDLHPGDPRAEGRFKLINAAHWKLTGKDMTQFDRQLGEIRRELGASPEIKSLAASIAEIESGIGTTKVYPSGHRIQCVFTPSLSTLVRTTFDCVVCDEAVAIKSGTAFAAQGVLNLEPRFRLALTGTPIKNKLPDLFFLCSWVAGHTEKPTARWPYGNTTADRAQFASDFGVLEENLTAKEKAHEEGTTRGSFTRVTANICNVHRLWRILGPVLIRRRKDDVPGCDIVRKTVVPVRIMPGREQQQVYKYQLDNPPPHDSFLASLGAQLQCLRQAALHPSSPQLARIEQPSARSTSHYTPKFAAIIQRATDLMEKGEQLVIFSPFQDFSAVLSSAFTQAAIPHLTLDGTMNPGKRGKLIKRFKSGEFPILIAGIRSMGAGHNLDCCSNLILPGLEWALDSNNQAIDRVHRLTSRKDVTIYVIVTRNTIDERLVALWQEKGDASDLAVDGRLVEQDREEIDLADFLRDAVADFDPEADTIDEAEVEASWKVGMLPALRHSFLAYRRQRIILPQPATTPPQQPSTTATATPSQNPQSTIHNPQSSIKPRSLFDLMKQRRSSSPAASPPVAGASLPQAVAGASCPEPTPPTGEAANSDRGLGVSPHTCPIAAGANSDLPPPTSPPSTAAGVPTNIIHFPARLTSLPSTAKKPVVIPSCLR